MRKNLRNLIVLLFGFLIFSKAHAQNTTPYWSLAGNSNATTTSKLGTTAQVALYITTNNTTRMYISPKVGYVGIGTTNPLGKLFVLNNGSSPATVWTGSGTPLFGGFAENISGNADFFVSMASNTASARPVFIGKRSRGTLAAPALVANNDYLVSLRASGYDGSSFQNTATIDFLVDGATAASKVPTRISFATGTSGTNRTERLRIASNGDFPLTIINYLYKKIAETLV